MKLLREKEGKGGKKKISPKGKKRGGRRKKEGRSIALETISIKGKGGKVEAEGQIPIFSSFFLYTSYFRDE